MKATATTYSSTDKAIHTIVYQNIDIESIANDLNVTLDGWNYAVVECEDGTRFEINRNAHCTTWHVVD